MTCCYFNPFIISLFLLNFAKFPGIFTDFLVFDFDFLVLYHPWSALVFQLAILTGLYPLDSIEGHFAGLPILWENKNMMVVISL